MILRSLTENEKNSILCKRQFDRRSFPRAFSGNPGESGLDPRLKHSGVTRFYSIRCHQQEHEARNLGIRIAFISFVLDTNFHVFE